MGGGYEHDDWYSNIEFSFMDIGNIHVMRERYVKIRLTVHDPVEKKMKEGKRRKKRLLYLHPKLSSGLVPL